MDIKEKNQIVLTYINSIKERLEKKGFNISNETYQKILAQYLDSSKSFEEIKKELDEMVDKKIEVLKREKEKDLLKQINLEDYQIVLLTLKSLNKNGTEQILNSNIDLLSTIEISHNAPINVNFSDKNGFYKNSARTSSSTLDKLEYIICQLGKKLDVKMAETYMVYNENSFLGIISENVCKTNESLYMCSQISKLLYKNNSEIAQLFSSLRRISEQNNVVALNSQENVCNIPFVENSDDANLVIRSFIDAINSLEISDEEKRNIRKDYFNMIMLDFIVNNVDRNQNNYGIIISEDGSIRFADLFDNSTIGIPNFPKGYQQINGFLIDKRQLINCLFENYYEDIKKFCEKCIAEEQSIISFMTDLCSKELSESEKNWFLHDNLIHNLRLLNNKTLEYQDEERIDYEKISAATNQYGKFVINNILMQYSASLSEEQKNMLNDLRNSEFIIIDRPCEEDIEFFSKQKGIENASDYDKKYVPSAHGGRTKGDNKIHIYLYSKSFEKCKNSDEIIAHCIRDLVSHEIFHYIIRPKINYEDYSIEADFGHFITEGLVQKYAIEFAQNNNLHLPNSNYLSNVELVNKLMNGMPEGTDLDKMTFSSSMDELINTSLVGKEIFGEYKERIMFETKLGDLISRSATSAGFIEEQITSIQRYYSKISDKGEIARDLSDKMATFFSENPELHQTYMTELQSLIPEHFEQPKTESDVKSETHSLEQEGPKLVRKPSSEVKPTSESKADSSNDGKINLLLITIISTLVIFIAFVGMYIIYN